MKKLLLTAIVSFCIGSLAMAQQAKTKTTTKAATTNPAAKNNISKGMLKKQKPLTEKEAIIAKEKQAAEAQKVKVVAAKEEKVESAAKNK